MLGSIQMATHVQEASVKSFRQLQRVSVQERILPNLGFVMANIPEQHDKKIGQTAFDKRALQVNNILPNVLDNRIRSAGFLDKPVKIRAHLQLHLLQPVREYEDGGRRMESELCGQLGQACQDYGLYVHQAGLGG